MIAGTAELRIDCTMSRIEMSSPPGVSRPMTSARYPPSSASATDSEMKSQSLSLADMR